MTSPTDPKPEATAGTAPRLEESGPAPARPRLVSIHGANLGKRWTVAACGVVIGRDPKQAGLSLPDPAISARHCALEFEPVTGKLTVSDLGSRNGTFVNGEKVSEHPLVAGDKLFVGETVLELVLDEGLGAGFHSGIDGRPDVDALTGLLVKRAFDLELARAFSLARERGGSLLVLMMELDEQKSLGNDRARKMGSLCIAEVGRIIRAQLGRAGCACRCGSEQFLALLNPVSLNVALELGERIRAGVAAYEFERDGARIHPTLSVGIAEQRADLPTPDHLLQAADEALYRAKRDGRNQVSR